MSKSEKTTDFDHIRNILNKKAGMTVAYNLEKDNPTDVEEWISTGSRWLDSVVCKGRLAGIPVGKISEIAGLPSAGKSYLAAQVAANAQKMGIRVVYFDSESALDSSFLIRAGCELSSLIYTQAKSVEFVFDAIETLLKETEDKYLFLWDSYAFTPCEAELEGGYNPRSDIALKARVSSLALSKLTQPVANRGATLVVMNQLKTNITTSVAERYTDPWITSGGKACRYSFSLRIWLTGKKGKASFVYDDKGFRIGSETAVRIKKSRFGTLGRTCQFKILWGEDVKIKDEESWLDALKGCESLKTSGAWYTLVHEDGSEVKFQTKTWMEKLKDDTFRDRVLQLMDVEVIQKFETREGEASRFYDEELD